MIKLPEFLKPFELRGRQLLEQGGVKEIHFAGATYQVQVIDDLTNEEAWAFIQLDITGNIKDCFCSCETAEVQVYCPHICASFFRIHKHQLPLHQRFEGSLWNSLCFYYSVKYGDDPDIFEKIGPGNYILNDESFSIQSKTPEMELFLKKFIDQRIPHTEETSLKFSNISEEELENWRIGNPSESLRYELSFWSDLAHWMMKMQDLEKPHSIDFEYGEDKLPNRVHLNFQEASITFSLPLDVLTTIIPTLNSVNSSIGLHHTVENRVESITYDQKQKSFKLQFKKNVSESKVNGISVDRWTYVPEEGFYAEVEDSLLSNKIIPTDKIGVALEEHFHLIKKRIKGTVIHSEPVDILYSLSFDGEWNLHLVACVFDQGDLSQSGSYLFENWVFLPQHGFYRIRDSHFDELHIVIPEKEVGTFVVKESVWLSSYEGFRPFITSIDTQLSYSVSDDNKLRFERVADIKNKKVTKKFGSWVYVAGQGFYSKLNTQSTLSFRIDLPVYPEQLGMFIRLHRKELEDISGFFTDKNPIEKIWMEVCPTEKDEIILSQKYLVLEEFKGCDVRVFDDFVYVAGAGFIEIPHSQRIPESFRNRTLIDAEKVPEFLKTELPVLELSPWVKLDGRLKKTEELQLHASIIERSDKENEGWFSLEVEYQSNSIVIPFQSIWNKIKQKKTFLFSDAGIVSLTDARFDWIRLLPKTRYQTKNNRLFLTILELIRLNSLDPIACEPGTDSAKTLEELNHFYLKQLPNLTGLEGQLREYQKNGVHWLWFLYEYGLSGLLCDDMGLGKTHQSMALLAAVINNQKQKKNYKRQQFLVICPTSVIYHWEEKLHSYFPSLKVHTFHGSSRTFDDIEHCDVLLTSYGVWRREFKELSKISFEVAVFDEVQIAKNHRSRIHASLRQVNSRMRLGLTGTPIENQLRELKSLFDLVLPTYMPNEKDYNELFVRPIERDANNERRELLKRFVKPFMLRRKKEEVLPDLPEKVEEISYCDLDQEQYLLYQQVLNQSRQELLRKLEDTESSIPYMHIFTVLSYLKQICNHPAVYLRKAEEYKKYQSGKWDLFLELFQEARASQQKVVIFSQYLTMLDIFTEYLNEQGIGFATIRGATVNRGEQVHRFNNDPECRVFLGSLQASGLGLDLTAGSVVIHYDRWWNSARENQATDRVHRIGQTRGVQVFKLVTKGTFEERIDEIIANKARLLDDVVTIDDHRFMKLFTRDELIQLLRDVEETKVIEHEEESL